jgi:hypothetical protein
MVEATTNHPDISLAPWHGLDDTARWHASCGGGGERDAAIRTHPELALAQTIEGGGTHAVGGHVRVLWNTAAGCPRTAVVGRVGDLCVIGRPDDPAGIGCRSYGATSAVHS